MNRRLLRRLAITLIALLGFAQASVALAACFMERGEMAQMAAMECCGDAPEYSAASAIANDCLAHCTSDLQHPNPEVVLVQSLRDVPVLVLSPPREAPSPEPPTGRLIPRRILLHSFLI